MKCILHVSGWILSAIVIGIGLPLMIFVKPGGDGVLASLRLEDGSQYAVIQHCNWSIEPYTVDFYVRAAEEDWGWCYIDHEAERWHEVTITHNPANDEIVITEQGIRKATLVRKRQTFIVGHGSHTRSLPAPQDHREPEYVLP